MSKVIRSIWNGYIIFILCVSVLPSRVEGFVRDDIYSVKKEKHPIQKVLEEQGLIFSEPSYTFVKTIFPPVETPDSDIKILYSEEQKGEENVIVLKLEQKKPLLSLSGKPYYFSLSGPDESINDRKYLPENYALMIQISNFKEDHLWKYAYNPQKERHWQLKVTYNNEREKVFHNIDTTIINNLYYGPYEFIVEDPWHATYEAKIDIVKKSIEPGSTIFVSQNTSISELSLDELENFVQEGGNMVVVSNVQVGRAFGVEFQKTTVKAKKILQKQSFFNPGEVIEVIQTTNRNKGNDSILFEVTEGALIRKAYYRNKTDGISTIIFMSGDIFSLEKQDIVKIIKNIIPSANTGINIEGDEANTRGGTTDHSGAFLKMMSLILALAIVGLLCGEKVYYFLKRQDKLKTLKEHAAHKSQTARNLILRYLYKIIGACVLLGIGGGFSMYYFYRWYTTSSGLDLIPGFKIATVLEKMHITQNKEAILTGIVLVLSLLLCFLLWLLWERVKVYWSGLQIFLRQYKWFQTFMKYMRSGSTLIFGWCGILFLYMYFLKIPGSLPMFVLTLVSGTASWAHSVWEKNNVIDYSESKYQKYALRLLKIFIFSLPIIVSLQYFLVSKNTLLFTKKIFQNQILFQTAADSSKKQKTGLTLENPEALKDGMQAVFGGKYSLIKEFPLIAKIASNIVSPTLNKKFITIEIESRLKSNVPIKLEAGNGSSKTISPFFFPILDAFKYSVDVDNLSIFSKKPINNVTDKKMTLAEFFKKTLPLKSLIGIMEKNKGNQAYKQLGLSSFYISSLEENFNENEWSDFRFNMKNDHFVFFTYLRGRADITLFLQAMNRKIGSEELYFTLKNGKNEKKYEESFSLKRETLGTEGEILAKTFKVENLTEGIYSLSLQDVNASDDLETDYLLKGIKINSAKLVFQGEAISQGGDILFFINTTANPQFIPSFETNLSFFELGGNVKSLNMGKIPETLSELEISANEHWKIFFPKTGGTLKTPTNIYSFSEESWFYPYEFYFTEISEQDDYILIPRYHIPQKDDDFFIIKNTMSMSDLSRCGDGYCFSLNTYENNTPLVILDWIKVTLQEKSQ